MKLVFFSFFLFLKEIYHFIQTNQKTLMETVPHLSQEYKSSLLFEYRSPFASPCMETNVAYLCSRLSLTDLEKEEVCVALCPLEEVVTKGSHYLLSKLLSF